jgi:hypothetical protein
MDQTVLGAAAQARNDGAGHRLDQSFRERPSQVGTVERHARDPLAFEEAGKAAHGGFDFWKFGHGAHDIGSVCLTLQHPLRRRQLPVRLGS